MRFPMNLIPPQLGHANLSVTSRYLNHIVSQEGVEVVTGKGVEGVTSQGRLVARIKALNGQQSTYHTRDLLI